MTTAEKAAQLIMPWVSGGYTAWDEPGFVRIVRLVDSLKVGGIVISIGSPMEVAARLNHLQRRARVPLLVASDFEGGTAFRINGGTAFPTNMGVGAGGQETDAWEMGRIIAEEGRALGVHLAFSPVADVNNNPANPIINTRSFGGDPALVARMVTAQIRGAQSHGMPSTVKHFPGHGDTGTDTHIAYAVIPATWRRLDTLELVPFRAAVKAGVSAVMTAHVVLPSIDTIPNRPATMAPEILTGILRDSLDFKGLVVSDALDMGAIVNTYGPGEAAVMALLAGNDILLMPTDPVAAVQALVQAVRRGTSHPGAARPFGAARAAIQGEGRALPPQTGEHGQRGLRGGTAERPRGRARFGGSLPGTASRFRGPALDPAIGSAAHHRGELRRIGRQHARQLAGRRLRARDIWSPSSGSGRRADQPVTTPRAPRWTAPRLDSSRSRCARARERARWRCRWPLGR